MSSWNKEQCLENIKGMLKADLQGAEMRLAMFSAAMNSYRNDSCLRPFPDIFDQLDKHEVVSQLKVVLSSLCKLTNLNDSKLAACSDECLKTLNWIFNEKVFTVKSTDKSVIGEVKKITGNSSFAVQPDFVFEVGYRTRASEKFDEQAQEYGVKLGFHGSRMDNFHSIVNNGLQVHMMKNGLYGEGVYLTEDLAVSMPYVTGGTTWSRCGLGHLLSCVAVCEILDHPLVKYTTETRKGTSRSLASNSEGGEVPQKYFVVTSSELMRVKYLYVFVDRVKTKPCTRSWIFFRYPVTSILVAYLLLLVCIGLYNNRNLRLYWKRYWRNKDS